MGALLAQTRVPGPCCLQHGVMLGQGGHDGVSGTASGFQQQQEHLASCFLSHSLTVGTAFTFMLPATLEPGFGVAVSRL